MRTAERSSPAQEETAMKILKIALVVLTIFVVAGMMVVPAQAQRFDKDTKVTFSQPVEIPGKTLAPGSYRFRVLESATARNVVQIWNEDATQLITTVLCIYDYRLEPEGETVMEFHERPAGRPVALRAWFYPGHHYGHEFVYPKARAVELARETHEIVPAETVEPTEQTFATVPLIAVTPEAKELPVEQAIQTTPSREVAQVTPPPAPVEKQLPKTASSTPLIALFGLAALGLAIGLRLLARRLS